MTAMNLPRFFGVILLFLFMTVILVLHNHDTKEAMNFNECECIHDSKVEKNVKLSMNNCLPNFYPELQMYSKNDQDMNCNCICVQKYK